MKKRIRTIIIFTLLVMMLTIGIVIYTLQNRFRENPPGTLGNTAGNLMNGGLFCEDNGIVYFSNPYDGGALYSMNADETDIRKITQGNVQSINSAGDYLYYYDAGSKSGDNNLGFVLNSSGFYMCKKKAKAKPEYIKRVSGTSIALIDNALYYETYDTKNHLSLYKAKADGSDEQLVSNEDINPSGITQSGFFFSQPGSDIHLQYWDAASDTSTELLAEDVYQPIMDGNFVYYIDVHNNYGISCVDLASRSVTQLINERVDCFNIANGIIYYQTAGDEYALKSANLDGSNVTVIMPGVHNSINVTSNYVYFKDFNQNTPVYRIPAGGTGVSTFDAAQQAVG